MGYVTNPVHIVILLLIVLLLFGGKRLPEVGRALGTGMREFKDALTGTTPPAAEPPAALPPAEPVATTATPPEHETVP